MNGQTIMVRGGLGVATAGVIAAVAFNVVVGVVLVILGLGTAVLADRLLTVNHARDRSGSAPTRPR